MLRGERQTVTQYIDIVAKPHPNLYLDIAARQLNGVVKRAEGRDGVGMTTDMQLRRRMELPPNCVFPVPILLKDGTIPKVNIGIGTVRCQTESMSA